MRTKLSSLEDRSAQAEAGANMTMPRKLTVASFSTIEALALLVAFAFAAAALSSCGGTKIKEWATSENTVEMCKDGKDNDTWNHVH